MAEKKSNKNNKNKSNKKGIIFIIIAVVVVVAISLTGYFLSNSNDDGNKVLGKNGDKTITVEVEVKEDEDIRTFIINTSADTLLEALEEQNLIDGEQQDYGYYITSIDGVKADLSLNQWWSIYVGEDMIDTIIDKTPIKDGDKFHIKLIG